MNYVLLLGAGFSRNWDGWLAEEVMGDLLSRVAGHNQLFQMLNRVGNFEDALSSAQIRSRNEDSAEAKAALDCLQAAIRATFGAMNNAFAERNTLNFSNDRALSVDAFLARFHSIFTLNQDLLLELNYRPELERPNRFPNGRYFPGMQPPANWQNAAMQDKITGLWIPAADRAPQNMQPIYKLHGSVNWRDAAGGDLMVMGANKEGAIREKEILNWCADEFQRCLEIPDTRLMVIGYGFRDRHIDEMLNRTWQRTGYKMFLVNPLGRAVFNKQPTAAIQVRDPMQDIPLIGISLRPLRTTFNGDELERGKLMRFFVD